MKNFKKFVPALLVLAACFLAAAQPLFAQDGKYVFLTVKGENVNLQDMPSAKGKVLEQAYGESEYLAEKTPIRDSGDNSQWYKLVYAIEELDGEFYPIEPPQYVNAKFSEAKPLEEYHQAQLDWIAAGKPAKFNTGDTLLTDVSVNDTKLVTLDRPFTLFLEPRYDAERNTFPKGTKVYLQDVDGRGDVGAFNVYRQEDPGTWYYCRDKNGDEWTPIAGEDRKIIGWIDNYADTPSILENIEASPEKLYVKEAYLNARFGYSMEYPAIFDKSREPDNGDGIEFESADGEYTLVIWGGYNVLEDDGESLLNGAKERVAHIVPDSERFSQNSYSIEYGDDGGQDGVEHIFHEYGIVNGSMRAGFVLKYPKEEEKRFAIVITDMENSLRLPESDGKTATEPPDISAFTLKNGRVYKEDTALDCEVYEIPSEVEGSIRFWSAFGTGASEAVRENETGVWFFTESGETLTFVPLESEYECQDVIFSPDGGSFVLVKGSGIRPDMFFEVYGEGTEKLAEFSGIRNGIEWADPARFVFTSIGEDIREGGTFLNLAYGLYLSVSMYDTAAKELTVLREATATQNFSLGGVTEDGSAVTIIEESVKSEKDWGDEEKIETREIEVEIPAAG